MQHLSLFKPLFFILGTTRGDNVLTVKVSTLYSVCPKGWLPSTDALSDISFLCNWINFSIHTSYPLASQITSPVIYWPITAAGCCREPKLLETTTLGMASCRHETIFALLVIAEENSWEPEMRSFDILLVVRLTMLLNQHLMHNGIYETKMQ